MMDVLDYWVFGLSGVCFGISLYLALWFSPVFWWFFVIFLLVVCVYAVVDSSDDGKRYDVGMVY